MSEPREQVEDRIVALRRAKCVTQRFPDRIAFAGAVHRCEGQCVDIAKRWYTIHGDENG